MKKERVDLYLIYKRTWIVYWGFDMIIIIIMIGSNSVDELEKERYGASLFR